MEGVELQALFNLMYKPGIEQEAKVIFNYDFRMSSSYQIEKIFSSNEDSEVSKILNLMNFKDYDTENTWGSFREDYSQITSHFVSGFSSKGAKFNEETYIDINSSEGFGRGHGTFVFGHEKINKGIDLIFSNYSGDAENPSGFEFGINNANKLFFEYMSKDGPEIFVFNNIPHKRNIYAVSVDLESGILKLMWWDASILKFEQSSFSIDSNYFREIDSSWIIGSGLYSGDESINAQAEPYSCSGYLDHFIYLDDVVGDFELELIARSFYEELDYTPAVTEIVAPRIIGYETEVTEVITGIVDWERVFLGYDSGKKVYYEFTSIEPIYGVADSGEQIYSHVSDLRLANTNYSNPAIYSVDTVSETTTGIIGFSSGISDSGENYIGQSEIYGWEGVTGEVYEKYRLNPIYGEESERLISQEEYRLMGGYPYILSDSGEGYGPKSYTYLGDRDSGRDYVEIQKGVNPLSVGNFANIEYIESQGGRAGVVFPSDMYFSEKSISLLINGVIQEKNDLMRGLDDSYGPIYEIPDSGDFGVEEFDSGNRIIPVQIYHEDTGLSLMTSSPMIDIINTGERQSLNILDTGDYSEAPFSEINPEGKLVYFNGQKIYEGVDYENDNGRFMPIEDVLSMTGKFFTLDDFHYLEGSDTGNNQSLGGYDVYEEMPFVIDSFVSHLNGIRLDPKSHVYHASEVDLISNKTFILSRKMEEVYNNKYDDYLNKNLEPVGGSNSDSGIPAMKNTLEYGSEGSVINENNRDVYPFSYEDDNDPDEILELGFDEV